MDITILVIIAASYLGLVGWNIWLYRQARAVPRMLNQRVVLEDQRVRAEVGEWINDRVQAEISKWAFTGGAGGAMQAWQRCTRCTCRTPVWRFLADEGPVCEVCCRES